VTQKAVSPFEIFHTWFACLSALLARELDERISRQGSHFVAVLEPIGLILMMSGGHIFLGGIAPPYGSSNILFYATGIIPHYIFIWTSSRISGMKLSIVAFPRIQIFDRVLANAIIESMTLTLGMFLLSAGLLQFGIREAWPYSIYSFLACTLVITVFGIGIGMTNAVIASYVPIWRGIYHVIVRGGMIISGLFFIPDLISPAIRQWLVWNPLLHAVGWFRLSFYPHYPSAVLDKPFLIFVSTSSLVVGLALEYATRRDRVLET
jgi:capsular polysaccharide transport system permease protein